MPLLNPKIQAALRSVNKSEDINSGDSNNIQTALDRAGLDDDFVLGQIYDLMTNSESEAIKARVAELVLKAKGFLKDKSEGPAAPVVNIIIKDSNQTTALAVNPILIPR